VKKLVFKNKNLIAISMAAVLVFAGALAYQSHAASRVDLSQTVTITAQVASDDTSVFASSYEGLVDVDLYKIASLDEAGKPVLADSFSNSGIDLGILNNNPRVDDIKTGIVEKAYLARPETPTATITFDKSQALSGSVQIANGAGIYLYVPRQAQDTRYTYTFTYYIISAPTSTYVQTGQGSDDWNYNATFNLKSVEERRSGYLEIRKTLDTFNESLGTASFVYTVEATIDGEPVYSNVFALNFDGAGTMSVEPVELPSDAVVTVTETYSGASYSQVNQGIWEQVQAQETSEIIADYSPGNIVVGDSTIRISFENNYNGKQIIGSIGVINRYEKTEDGFEWVGNNLELVAEPQAQAEQYADETLR